MAQDPSFENEPSELRRRAEELLRQRPEDIQAIPGGDIQRLIHELRVHQIELEMQNEEVRKTQGEINELLTKYFDLYELAPVGYFVLDKKGLILEANLTGANLLGVQLPVYGGYPVESEQHYMRQFGEGNQHKQKLRA